MGPPFYHITARPITLPPQDPQVKFHLYTRDNPDKAFDLEINEESLKNSSFNPKWPTKFLIHGFLDKLPPGDIRYEMVKALLKIKNFNVIIVDWSGNNNFPYAQAVSNIRSEGAKVAQLIHFLINNAGITPESVHIIGHSLGGQMAGYIGERVPNLGRITGLDPAGPFFQGLDKRVRLDPSDALFVDVIHTDGGEYVLSGFGSSETAGHIDFYPNGGRNQPGCYYKTESGVTALKALSSSAMYLANNCGHVRVLRYFLESLDNSRCAILAYQCSSYVDFQKGLCPPENSTTMEMGLRAHPLPGAKPPVKFFLRTYSSPPYCSK